MFAGETRRAFLEFLRNLTPQILFLTIALISSSNLELNKFDLSAAGLWRTLPFALCIFVFLGSAMANVGIFIDSAVTSSPELDERTEEIRSTDVSSWKRTWLLICAAWKHNKSAFFQIILAMVICEVAFVVVYIVAVQGAIASPFFKK